MLDIVSGSIFRTAFFTPHPRVCGLLWPVASLGGVLVFDTAQFSEKSGRFFAIFSRVFVESPLVFSVASAGAVRAFGLVHER